MLLRRKERLTFTRFRLTSLARASVIAAELKSKVEVSRLSILAIATVSAASFLTAIKCSGAAANGAARFTAFVGSERFGLPVRYGTEYRQH